MQILLWFAVTEMFFLVLSPLGTNLLTRAAPLTCACVKGCHRLSPDSAEAGYFDVCIQHQGC